MTTLGIVSPVADQTALAAVGPEWVAAVKAISPKLTDVRVAIGCSAKGICNVSLLKRGLQAFKDGGLHVSAVLEANLGPMNLNPNDFLGYQGSPFLNQFISEYSDSAVMLLGELEKVNLCPDTVWICNEGNVQAAANPRTGLPTIPALKLGDKPDHEKPEAMAPEAWWSLQRWAAGLIQLKVPAVKHIIPGGLSCDAAFKTSMYDNWVGNYIETGMQYLVTNGLRQPWPWEGLCLNVEGIIPYSYARYLAGGLSFHKGNWGINGPNIWGEWGVPNPTPKNPANNTAVQESYFALANVGKAAAMYWYAAQPDRDYGCLGLGFKNGEIVPLAPLYWGNNLGDVLSGVWDGTTTDFKP